MSEFSPLDGIQVLDLTQSIAGPTATQYLGMLGADVIKVEPPNGDAFRGLLDGAMFSAVNLGNKRSVAIDLKTEDGQAAASALADESDVIIESYRPNTVDKFGLDYETVSEYNEDVVYVSLSGYGQDGPRSDWPAYDPAIQAVSGLMSTIGYPDRPPVRIGASVGVAMLTDGEDCDEVLRAADLAMYEAKEDGKARVRRFEATMLDAALSASTQPRTPGR